MNEFLVSKNIFVALILHLFFELIQIHSTINKLDFGNAVSGLFNALQNNGASQGRCHIFIVG